MMTAILIDDEMPALMVLEHYLCLTGEISVLGKYSDPFEGIEAVTSLKPQTVFLDIDMPELKGIETASIIMEKFPDTIIVFVTAYSEYAVQAYEISALDYLLKPISKERLDKTINRLKNSMVPNQAAGKRRLKIKCLGGFSLGWEGEEPIKWRSRKTQEVIAFLIQNKEVIISSEVLIDTIWPDAYQENGSHLLRNAIYYIRRALKDYGVTDKEISIKNRYCLMIGDADLDVDVFKRHYEQLQSDAEIKRYIECTDRYTGEYFAGNGWLWAEQKRAKLLRMYLRAVSQTARLLIHKHNYAAAEEHLLKGLREEPYEESIVLQLLELYGQTGERVKAKRLYKAYSEMTTNELGCYPSKEITKIFCGNN